MLRAERRQIKTVLGFFLQHPSVPIYPEISNQWRKPFQKFGLKLAFYPFFTLCRSVCLSVAVRNYCVPKQRYCDCMAAPCVAVKQVGRTDSTMMCMAKSNMVNAEVIRLRCVSSTEQNNMSVSTFSKWEPLTNDNQ